VHLLGDVLLGFVPPVQQGGGGGSGRRAWDPKPRNGLVPDLAREGALHEQVLHRFGALVAKVAGSMVRQATTRQAFRCPASVQVGKPVKESDARRRPAFPEELP
jgi:hypothetical protein